MDFQKTFQTKIYPFVADLAFKMIQEALLKVGEEVRWGEIKVSVSSTIKDSQVPKVFHGFLERLIEFFLQEFSAIFSKENVRKYEDINQWSVAFFGKRMFEDDLGESKKLPSA